tara:strand:- start:2564 stop:2971 length:408 start_codon:yes stop_codon:yes gene_type:complete
MKNYNLTAADVSAATNLTVGTVYNAKHKGLLKSIKHKSNIFFAEEDVKEWRDNTKKYNYQTVSPIGGGYADYRTDEVNKLMGRNIRLGHWTDFGFAVKLQARRDQENGKSDLNLKQTMRRNALECLRILDNTLEM